MPSVLVPVARWERWVANFATGHGGADLTVADGALRGQAVDGSHFAARLFGSCSRSPLKTSSSHASR